MIFKNISTETGQDLIFTNDRVASFLEHHLGRFGDKKEDILACLSYVFAKGGFIVLAVEETEILGAVVVNETGMKKYIPENILVYIAVHENMRGKGLGKSLMEKTIETAKGDVALHVEADNPAKKLYERLGFSNKYLEMRLQR
ncbi:MAG: GNAT family N-acetyltransferase [Pedobacter sp.]|nr:GNAT family N-acetyltransferase [Pedobacter sp.]